VLKELPILGPDSQAAARLMLAANRQGKYFDMFEQMLTTPGRATTDEALRVAGDLGLDTALLEKDAADPAVDDRLAATTQLAKAIGVNGAPFLIVGDRVIGIAGKGLYGEGRLGPQGRLPQRLLVGVPSPHSSLQKPSG
jgi:protein-disulfide isomerase